MSPLPKPCLACGALTEGGSRCEACQHARDAAREAARPAFAERRGMGGWRWGKLRAAIRARDGGCVRCGSAVRLEVHHVMPLAEGGTNAPENLVTLCRRCHGRSHRAGGS